MSTKLKQAIGLIPLLFALTIFVGCNHDHDFPSSPAGHIAASENLIIPGAVAVPVNSPNGNTRVITFYAKGLQLYKAKKVEGSDPTIFEWSFVAPKADLYDYSNKKVGNHGAGPFWTISPADSIFAQAFTPARTALAQDAGSIDWLLLMPKDGKTPTGILADVDYIQRIATKGGKAPAQAPANANSTTEVPYEAIYRFTKKNP